MGACTGGKAAKGSGRDTSGCGVDVNGSSDCKAVFLAKLAFTEKLRSRVLDEVINGSESAFLFITCNKRLSYLPFYFVSLRLESVCVSVQGDGASRGRKTRGWGRRRLVFLLLFRPGVFFLVLFLVALDAVSFVPA